MVHMRFHAGEKSYVCDICPKSFVTKSDLTRHGKVHYDKGVQLYKVSIGNFFTGNGFLWKCVLLEMLFTGNAFHWK